VWSEDGKAAFCAWWGAAADDAKLALLKARARQRCVQRVAQLRRRIALCFALRSCAH
jgi:hypothetical protein